MKRGRHGSFRGVGLGMALAICALFLVNRATADVIYEFTSDTSPFDAAGIGASETLLDGVFGINITLTTLDIIGQDGSLASDGTNNLTNITGTNNSMGINSLNNGPDSNEAQDFNPGEGWIASFDVTVRLMEIDFASQDLGARMTISSSAFADIVLDDGAASDIHDLGSVLVPAGTAITFAMTNEAGLGADRSLRIDDLTVSAIPEPSALGLVLFGAALVARARRRG